MNRVEDELRYVDRIVEGRGVALDIGANRGHYSYVLSGIFREVHAFEPNPGVAGKLREYGARNVESHDVALSSEEGELELFVPIVDGVEQHGWASFDPGNMAGAREFTRVKVPVRTLDSFALPEVAFVKIDVEGHEVAVLRGAIETLRHCRPVVLIEVKEANEETVLRYFEELGYERYRLEGGHLVLHPRGSGPYPGENFVFRPAR
jgi:FkbM family methyltransferase